MFAHLHDSFRRCFRHRHNKKQVIIQEMRIYLGLQLFDFSISPQLCFNLQGSEQRLDFYNHVVKAFKQIEKFIDGVFADSGAVVPLFHLIEFLVE
ncbi:hypothetical protein D3C71_1851340 [compost metagenome]